MIGRTLEMEIGLRGGRQKRKRSKDKENKGGRTETRLRIRDGKLREVLQVASESTVLQKTLESKDCRGGGERKRMSLKGKIGEEKTKP